MKTPRERPAARVLTAVVWHQCSLRHALLDAANPAVTTGRYHRTGGPGVWYASSSENGAWAELFRHHEPGGVSPLEVIRRIGRARVKGLRVLDLTNARVREMLDVSERELTGDELTRCQEIADYARDAGFDAILAPSAALEGQRTIAIFSSAMRKITEERSRVGSPPVRAPHLLGRVRLPRGAFEDLARILLDDYPANLPPECQASKGAIKNSLQFFGDSRAIDIIDDRLNSYVVSRQDKAANATINRKLDHSKGLFGWQAEELDNCPDSVCCARTTGRLL